MKNRTQRRVRARGLQDAPPIPFLCRPGPITGRISRPALKGPRRQTEADDAARLNDLQPQPFRFRQHRIRFCAGIEP